MTGQDLSQRVRYVYVGLGGIGVTCSPRDPTFVGSNPADVDGFFQDVKIMNTSPPGRTLSREIGRASCRERV